MNKKKFEEWLEMEKTYSKSTIQSRVSNVKMIEKYYPDLDASYNMDHCSKIVNEFTYTIEDEQLNQPAKHRIPINGRLFTGTATYKLALRLYINFRDFEKDEKYYQKLDQVSSSEKGYGELQLKVEEVLKGFSYSKKLYQTNTNELQIALYSYLQLSLSEYKWEIEYKPSDDCKDSVDLYGYSSDEKFSIILEIDAHRADQVAKKFVSRTSLFIDANVFYISLCYPGTKKMSKAECSKYFNYCAKISDHISNHGPAKKMYMGYYFNQQA